MDGYKNVKIVFVVFYLKILLLLLQMYHIRYDWRKS